LVGCHEAKSTLGIGESLSFFKKVFDDL
jgi:hypothetical protein